MAEAAISLATSAASPILTKLADKAVSYFGGDVTEEELRNLKSIVLPKIQTVIKAVDNINKIELKPWVMNLRAAAYEAEDVLDMYEYNHLQAKVSPPPNSLKKFNRIAKNFFAPVTLKTKLKKSLEKLQKAADGADRVFGPLIASLSASSSVPSDTMNRPPSVSSLSSEVFGRDEECKSIVDMLISEGDGSSNNSESRIQILAIWGIGGAGKTTLAQYIFNDRKIAEHFPMKIWVDVSRQLDALKVTAKMIVDVTGTERPSKESLDALQARLKKHLESNKRFLLVLDDVWLDEGQNRLQLDQLLIPFNEVGDIGSRILLTTRAERTAKLMSAKHIIPVKELESEFCWSIIKQYAFRDSQKVISDPELVKIGDQIVNKLKNSPLAATLVGIQLGIQVDINAWRMVLEGDILNDTRNVLLWSYKKLPQHLQQCFSFCSLFPQGWNFDKSKLVRLWIAQGFVVIPNRSKLTIEDKGSEYFNDLLSFSFFKLQPRGFDKKYVIHDLLHDLAENVSQDHCFRIEDDKPRTIPPTVIHLSINVTNTFDVDIANILELVNLHTLFIISLPKVDFRNNFQDASKIFRKLKKLRILHLGRNSMSELHSSICELKHIRYLQLSWVRTLPGSLGQLYHLHFLVLDSNRIEIVPRSLSNLINLKHFDTFFDDHIIFEVPEFGKLISLQRLQLYDANRRSQCGIDQLKNLRGLRGSLRIRKLQNIESKAEACEAMLKDKIHLDQLALEWDIDTERNDQVIAGEELDGLEPPCNLKKLEIRSYIGAKSPRWLEDNQCLSNLQELKLFDCSNLQVHPLLGQLSSLRKLKIRNAKVIEGIGPEIYGGGRDSFPSLKVLKLTGMEKWERWHGAEGVELHPCLEKLVIEDCPQLMEMPSLPPTLRRLTIANCPSLLQLPSFPCGLEEVDMKGPIGTSLTDHLALDNHLTTLKSLRIDGCENLRSVVGLELLPSLRHLRILSCVKLSSPCLITLPSSLQSIRITKCNEFSMPTGCLLGLTSLIELRMEGFPKLQSLPDLSDLRSLMILKVEGCPNLQSLPDLSDLRALKILEVVDCPQLTCIGNLHRLTSLQWLTVLKCPKLTRGTVPSTVLFKENLHCLTSLPEMTIDETLLLSMLLQLEALNSLFQLNFSHCHSLSLPANLWNLSSLQKLYIGSCPNLRSLPNLENLSSLKNLFIFNCPQIQSLPNLDRLSSLQFLCISHCNEIRLLPNLDELSSLASLTIASCPQISSLPNLENLSSLNQLEISMCPQIASLPNLNNLSSLNRLEISNCPQIEQLPNLDKLSSLGYVHIRDCNELRSLPSLDDLSSLKTLQIKSCPKIESLPQLKKLSSLRELEIADFLGIESVPHLEKLSSLERLQISNCPQLKSLPNLLPSSLETLYISSCHPELREKYRKGGPLRHRLRHISALSGDLMYEVDSDDIARSCCPLPSWILKQ